MKIKPACVACKKPYLVGRDGLCRHCLDPGSKRGRLRCQCGKAAVRVILATVFNPEGAPRLIQLALCRGCLALERQMEAQSSPPPASDQPNPIRIVIVDRLPQTKNPPKGRRLA